MFIRIHARPVLAGRLPRNRAKRLGTLLLLVLCLSCLWSNVVWPRRYVVPGLFGQAVFSVQTTAPLVALTFDDGPNPLYTPQILDILAAHGVKATFFMVGQAMASYPEVAAQVIRQGHEVGNHSWSHHSLNRLGPAAIRREITTTDVLI
ncbi:MAG TPA: polysaccharide deacetylase family protein, partial [Leptolyngbyaceae cyanobacterium M65_K2018_010]|nr:polysaccharide deacetylase family protein [Leptolyngbyaceae cyanobacterium M65_K2018_010]